MKLLALLAFLFVAIFMHFWANDDAIKLARGLRAALDKTASKMN
jgi:hypothetical protein